MPGMFGKGFACELRGLVFGFFCGDGGVEIRLLVGEAGSAGEGREELRVGTEGVE